MDPSQHIDQMIASFGDWRSQRLAQLRQLINQADPELNEEWKWGTAVWTAGSRNVCALGGFKDHLKINFFKGASIPDPQGLFNSGLDAKASRAIDLTETDAIDVSGLTGLIKAAVKESL